LLGALAVGLGGYALWRFAEAVLGRTLETGEDQGFLKRVGLVARGLFYSWLCIICARSSSRPTNRSLAAEAGAKRKTA
jgi:hypothetical protein